MPYKDLREWIARVEEMGELVRMEGVDWNLEMGALTEIIRKESDPSPAILFDRIKGYPAGYQVISSILTSLKRLALTNNMPFEKDKVSFIKAWRERSKGLMPISPRTVKDGPVLENVRRGKDINLWEFPVPFWHELDGGRYLGTGCAVITRDPEQGSVNLGTYRIQVHNENTLAFYASPGKHGRIHREKYYEQGKPCPVAISFGHDPLIFLVGAIEVPHHYSSEYDYAGAVKGEPIEVIEGEYTGLPIPATAEIVIEGESYPDERMDEGPFGEWTGYYGSDMRPEPTIRVKSLMYRNNPIICGAPPAKPPTDSTFFTSILRSALIWNELEAVGVPDVRGVYCYEEGGSKLLAVISIKQRYPGHARQAGMIATQCRTNAYLGRFVIVVDEDIDPSDTKDMLWAMISRADPERSIEIIRRCWSGPLDPAIPKDKKGFNSRAIIDACRPYEWIQDFPPVATTSPELRQTVMAKWGEAISQMKSGKSPIIKSV